VGTVLLTISLQNCQQTPGEPAVPQPEPANWQGPELAGSHWQGPAGLGERLRAAVVPVLVEKGAEGWKAQPCCPGSRWPLGSSPATEAGVRSGGSACCEVLLRLSSAQPHPDALLPSSSRGPGVSDRCCSGGLSRLELGNEGFSPRGQQLGCLERVASGQSSFLAGALGTSLCCWGERRAPSRGTRWLWLRWCVPLAGRAGSGQGRWLGGHGILPSPAARGVCLSPRLAERQAAWRRSSSGISASPELRQRLGTTVVPCLVTNLCSPGKTVLAHVCTGLWYPRVPHACVQLCQQLCVAAWAAWERVDVGNSPHVSVPSVQSSPKRKHVCFLLTWLPCETGTWHQGTPPLSPWVTTAVWKHTCQNLRPAPIRVWISPAQFKCRTCSQFLWQWATQGGRAWGALYSVNNAVSCH